MIDPNALTDLVDGYFVSAVSAVTGDGSGGRFKKVLTVIRQLYRIIEPSSVEGSITVFGRAASNSGDISGTYHTLGRIEELQAGSHQHLCLEVMDSGTIRSWQLQDIPDLATLSRKAVVYSYQSGDEVFWANGQPFEVHNVYPGNHSLFQSPAYSKLEQALSEYKYPIVRLGECEILASMWFDVLRMFLRSKPEGTMRRSLARFLRWQLRADAEVMPEQNVDETHPIDIRVTFNFANRVALIEIKWLGHSKNELGVPTTSYGPARANSGASQLADYLDSFHISLPNRVVRGYLIVFDCRRRRLGSNPSWLDSADGFYFADREIEFDPKLHITRSDFAEPIRMFAEPLCD